MISREMGNRSENSIKNRFNSKGFARKRAEWEMLEHGQGLAEVVTL